MPEPQSWPCVRYYADGRFVLVETPLDYAALDPGHADNPGGPFPPPGPSALLPLPTGETAREEEPESREQRALALWKAGQSKQAIAEALGVSPRTVGRLLEATDDADPP